MKPNPGRSGAITWYLEERRGMRLRNMWDDDGKPWSSRRTGAVGEPALR